MEKKTADFITKIFANGGDFDFADLGNRRFALHHWMLTDGIVDVDSPEKLIPKLREMGYEEVPWKLFHFNDAEGHSTVIALENIVCFREQDEIPSVFPKDYLNIPGIKACNKKVLSWEKVKKAIALSYLSPNFDE